MTNHLHLIISADLEDVKLWQVIRDFKKFTAQKIIQMMQKEENRRWILDVMKAAGAQNNANTQYQFWIQDDGAEEIQSDKFFFTKIYLHPRKPGKGTDSYRCLQLCLEFSQVV